MTRGRGRRNCARRPERSGQVDSRPGLLRGALRVTTFVDADVIARPSAFDPDAVAFAAGRVMRARLRELAAGGPASPSRPRWLGERMRRGFGC